MSQVLLPDEAERSMKNLVLAAYILLAVSLMTAIPTGLIGVIIAYVKRDEARGTWLAEHFRWQIEIFWYSLAGCILASLLFVTLIGIPLAIIVGAGTWLWMVYRLVKGFLRLN
ncbi:MAG: hypothetical protein JNM11_13000, partial [Chitinimonas sp.]|nr:hypothetical protein [Chitinimonas sp.]